MALTTHENIRVESGFQSKFVRQPFKNAANGVDTVFFVNSDDNYKFVPDFGTGSTIAGISDIEVRLGLSGVYGTSILGVSAIDIDDGSVRLSVIPVSGASLVITYSSSAISSKEIESIRLQAESIVNQRLSLCYDLPLSPTPSSINSLATRLASALLLIRSFGPNSRSTSSDGYALYEKLMGDNAGVIALGTDSEVRNVGEIGLICTPNYQLVDDSGAIVQRNDDEDIIGDIEYSVSGRIDGRIYDITEEPFRKKPWQVDVDAEQPGSGL